MVLLLIIPTLILHGCKENIVSESDVSWYELVHTPKENLQSGMFYVKTVTIGTEKEGSEILPAGMEVFYPIYFGAAAFDYGDIGKASAKRIFKLTQDVVKIPVLYAGDQLVYVNNSTPPGTISWERFEDLGYGIGISGIGINETGRYQFKKNETTVLEKSSIGEILKNVKNGTVVVIDKFNGNPIKEEILSRSGTILGLVKDESYPMDIYIGTHHYAINVVADCKIFTSYSDFGTNNYEYTDDGYAIITIPEGLYPGYYMLNGLGLFCYAGPDAKKSNGIFDIDFNQGIEYEIVEGETIYPEKINILQTSETQ